MVQDTSVDKIKNLNKPSNDKDSGIHLGTYFQEASNGCHLSAGF